MSKKFILKNAPALNIKSVDTRLVGNLDLSGNPPQNRSNSRIGTALENASPARYRSPALAPASASSATFSGPRSWHSRLVPVGRAGRLRLGERVSTLSEARTRLDQRRFSRPNTHFEAFFKMFKNIIISQSSLQNLRIF